MTNDVFVPENLGKMLIDNNGNMAKLIGICHHPTFDVEFDNGKRLGAAINSPLGQGWRVATEFETRKIIDRIDEAVTEAHKHGLTPNVVKMSHNSFSKMKEELNDVYFLANEPSEVLGMKIEISDLPDNCVYVADMNKEINIGFVNEHFEKFNLEFDTLEFDKGIFVKLKATPKKFTYEELCRVIYVWARYSGIRSERKPGKYYLTNHLDELIRKLNLYKDHPEKFYDGFEEDES